MDLFYSTKGCPLNMEDIVGPEIKMKSETLHGESLTGFTQVSI